MEAIILLAGYGSRLDRQDLPHKTLLPFGEETLLSRHLKCLQALGIRKTHLILGHNAPALQTYVQDLNLDLPIHFIDNPVYRTTGKTAPIFNDKHLSYRWDWAKEMYDTSKKHGIPFLAGSSVPLAQLVGVE